MVQLNPRKFLECLYLATEIWFPNLAKYKISRILSQVHLLNSDNCPKKKVKDEMYDRGEIENRTNWTFIKEFCRKI